MFTIFVTPPSCFRRPSLISASFPLPIFIFKPLYCAIFVLGLFCFLAVVMPLVGLTWAFAAIWSSFFCGLVDAHIVQILYHHFFIVLHFFVVFPPSFLEVILRDLFILRIFSFAYCYFAHPTSTSTKANLSLLSTYSTVLLQNDYY